MYLRNIQTKKKKIYTYWYQGKWIQIVRYENCYNKTQRWSIISTSVSRADKINWILDRLYFPSLEFTKTLGVSRCSVTLLKLYTRNSFFTGPISKEKSLKNHFNQNLIYLYFVCWNIIFFTPGIGWKFGRIIIYRMELLYPCIDWRAIDVTKWTKTRYI